MIRIFISSKHVNYANILSFAKQINFMHKEDENEGLKRKE